MIGKGALFPNRNKKTDKHPDYNGDFEINGVKYWLSAWTKQGKNGAFLSVSLGQPKEDRGEYQQHQQPQRQAPQQGFIDDEIPPF